MSIERIAIEKQAGRATHLGRQSYYHLPLGHGSS